MTLKPLPASQFDCLRDLIGKRIVESNLQKRSTVDDAIITLTRGYDGRFMSAYADNFENPQFCLIMAHFPGMATAGTIAHISLMWVDPAHRGDAEALEVLFQTAENYARLNGADVLVGTSWLYRGSKGTDSLWLKKGYEVQETQYVKHLT